MSSLADSTPRMSGITEIQAKPQKNKGAGNFMGNRVEERARNLVTELQKNLEIQIDAKFAALRAELLSPEAKARGLVFDGNYSKAQDIDVHAHRDEGEIPSKALGGAQALSTIACSGAVNGTATASSVVPGEVTDRQLDSGDMYERGESIWDACIFLGLPCLGPGVSVALAATCAMNFLIQLGFCIVIAEYMLRPRADGQMLDALLRFRIGVAHNVMAADYTGQRSMVSQICNQDDKLHMAGEQKSLINNLEDFKEGGPALSMLANFLWISIILKEFNSVISFVRALLHVPRGHHTSVVVSNSDGQETDDETPGKLEAIVVVTRLVKISEHRLIGIFLGIVLPRLFIAVTLCATGVVYLGNCERMEDLLLNALALAFVTDIDELMYPVLAPRRAQVLLANLEPLSMPHAPHAKKFPALHVALKLLYIAVVLSLIHTLVLSPFFGRLNQAYDILCTGDTDFVYAINPATGLVHVAKSRDGQDEWTPTERVLLSVARPEISAMDGWDLHPELTYLSQAPEMQAQIENSGDPLALSNPATFAGSPYEDGPFARVWKMSIQDITSAAQELPCADWIQNAPRGLLTYFMQTAFGDASLTACPHLSAHRDRCSDLNASAIRAVCPLMCGCHVEVGFAGVFGTMNHGCPQQCINQRALWDQIMGMFHCTDVPAFLFAGGPGPWPPVYALMVEAYGGWPDFAGYYENYIRSLFQYLTSTVGFHERVNFSVSGAALAGLLHGLSQEEVQSIVDHFASGAAVDSFLLGRWEVAPGLKHPRNLTGCAYLASPEIRAFLTLDICKPRDLVSSIRSWCPVTCGCLNATGWDDACPYRCHELAS